MNSPYPYLKGRAEQLLTLFESESVTDILVNGSEGVYFEEKGRVLKRFEGARFTEAELNDWVERLLVDCGRRLDLRRPYLDGSLSDGSRFHIIIPPLAPSGPIISIRRWGGHSAIELSHFTTPEITQWLCDQVQEQANLLVVGGTGSGKTTLLGKLLDQASPKERILILEESLEINTRAEHIVRLQCREGYDEFQSVGLCTLLKNALRMRPDRLIIGECRGPEAFYLLQAMNTGHRGVMSSLHANSARDGLDRLEALAHMGAPNTPLSVIRRWLATSVDAIVFLHGGVRQIAEVLEVKGLEGNNVRFLPRFES